MKRISLEEAKRNLKRVLKNKISINEKTVITYLMMGMIGLFTSTAVMAEAVTQGTGAQAHVKGVALGASFEAWNGPQNGAQANSEGAIAIGGGSVANTGKQSIAIGQSSKTTATQAIAIGGDTVASGVASIALGGDDAEGTPYANSKYNSTTGKVETAGSIQYQSTTASGAGSVSIGVKSQATADGTSALGVLATATGKEATALGAMSASKGERAVALGAGSIASGTKAFAAGDGSQATAKETIAIGSGSKASTDNAFAIGVGAQSTHANTIAMGTRAEALANSAVAIGNKAKSTGQDSVAFGTLSRTINSGAYASGIAARAVGKESVAIGWMTSTGTGNATYDDDKSTGVAHVAANSGDGDGKGEYSVSIGSNMAVTGSNSIGIGKAGNKAVASVSGDNSISLGNGNKIESNKVVAVGNSINIATGKEGAVALGDATSVTQAGGVALGNGSAATTAAGATGYDITGGTNTGKTWVSTGAAVSVGNATTTRQITNVAAGTEDTDAVNVAQLKKAKVNVVAGENVTVTPQVTADGTTYTISSKAKKTEVAAENGLTVAETAIDGGTRYTVKLDDATKRKIDNLNADELNAVKDKVNNQGITFKGNTNTTAIKKLGERLDIVGTHATDAVSSKNIKTEVNGQGQLEIKMAENPDFKSVTVTPANGATTVINGDGVQVGGATGPKLAATGLDNGGKKITNVANGTDDKDAVNYSQLNELKKTLGLAIGPDGKLTQEASTLRNQDGTALSSPDMVSTVRNTVEVVNRGVVYGGELTDEYNTLADGTNPQKQQLGSKLSVIATTTDLTGTSGTKVDKKYGGDNLITKYVRDAQGNGTISIGFAEKPVFKEVTAKDGTNETKLAPTGTTVKDTATNKETTYGVDGLSIKGADGQTTTLGRDADGNLTVTNGKDGQGAKALATKDDVNKVTDALGLPKNDDGTLKTDLEIPAVKGSDDTNAPTTILDAVKDTATA